MTKKIAVTFIMLLSIKMAIGQINSGEIDYLFTYQLDPSFGLVEFDAKLFFDTNESTFIYDQSDSSTQIIKSEDGGKIEIIQSTADKIGRVYYKNLKEDKLVFRNTPFKAYYLVEEAIPNIDWKLTTQKKIILGYECQQATGHFRGRMYHAWFTTKIPVSTGPYKFTGLPGLILEIYDEEKEVSFIAKGIRNLSDKSKIIIPSSHTGEKISSLEYFKRVRDIAGEMQRENQKFLSKFERGTVMLGASSITVSSKVEDYIERTHEEMEKP